MNVDDAHVPPAELSFSGGTLLLHNSSSRWISRWFDKGTWTWDPRVDAWRCDALWYETLRDRLGHTRCAFRDGVAAWRKVRFRFRRIHELRPEQEAALTAWNQTRRACLVMPTGTGKTEVALSIMAESEVSTLVVAPVRDLMYQWHRRIAQSLGYDAGIIGDNVFRKRPVSVTTYDSACIHMHRLGDQFGLIIFDECHHLPGPVRSDAARMSAAPLRLGLTATPERSDGRHVDLDWLIGPVAFDLPLSAVRGRTLADYDVVRIPIHLSNSEQRRYDLLAGEVQRYMAERRKTEPNFNWEDLCTESASTPEARRALNADFRSL